MASNEHAEPVEHLPGDGHETVVHGDHRRFQHDDHVHEH